jgi:hypothetical protein
MFMKKRAVHTAADACGLYSISPSGVEDKTMSVEHARRYQPANANIAHESLDGEVVAINVATGVYYSLTGTAAVIWDAMIVGASAREIASRFADGGADVLESCAGFLDSLVAEGLLAVADDALRAEAAPQAAVPFAPPVFLKYTDMQEMLLADPIHEVTEKGWPFVAQ